MKNLLVPVVLGSLALSGCDLEECTEIGCTSAVEVTFDADDGDAFGEYRLSVQTSKDEMATCSFTLGPTASGGDGGAAAGGANQGGAGGETGESSVIDADCTGSLGLVLEVRGTRRFEGFVVAGSSWHDATPEKVSFEVRIDGNVFAAQTFTPEFEEQRPNGDDCPPVCDVAQHEVSLSDVRF